MNKAKIVRYICFLSLVFSSWILLGQSFQFCLTRDKLVAQSGIIGDVLEVSSGLRNKKTHELRISLKGYPGYFRIMDIYPYQTFSSALQPGDQATIYIRPRWLSVLGMGHTNDIFQMAVNGKTVFDLRQTKSNAKRLIIFSLTALVLSFIFIFLNRKKSQ
jgi:hypothetical protein